MNIFLRMTFSREVFPSPPDSRPPHPPAREFDTNLIKKFTREENHFMHDDESLRNHRLTTKEDFSDIIVYGIVIVNFILA